jgi:hypothetical protein
VAVIERPLAAQMSVHSIDALAGHPTACDIEGWLVATISRNPYWRPGQGPGGILYEDANCPLGCSGRQSGLKGMIS